MKKLFFATAISLMLGSCSKFLDETPFDFVSPENIKASPVGVKQMVTGMYGVFFNAQMFHNEAWIYVTCSDDEWTNGLDWVLGTYGVGNFSGGWIYNNSGNDPYYVFYRMIRSANEVLEVLPGSGFSAEEAFLKDQYEGEALTMRALAYFYLVQMYGGVPLHLRSDDPSDMQRSSVAEVYQQIIKDLHTAEDKLVLNSKRTSAVPRGHYTKGAAQLLLAKVYNTMGSGSLASAQVTVPINITRSNDGVIHRDEKVFNKNKVTGYDFDSRVMYDSAKTVAGRLIETREYEMERYANNWNPANYGGKDFVFALETDSLFLQATTVFNRFFTPIGLGGTGWVQYTKDLYYLYDSTDERRLYGIAHEYKSSNLMPNGVWARQFFPFEDSIYYYEKYGAGNVIKDINNNGCYLMKWYLGNAASPKVALSGDEATRLADNPTQNYPLLRYVEAYLILAEAENEINGPTATAFDALDLVRSYRYRDSDNKINRTMTKEQLRSYILDERNKEFIGEGYRRLDMIRWGIYLNVMNAVDHRAPFLNRQDQIISKRREQKHLLYPVPTIEIDGNRLFGPNNPGW